MVLPAASFRLLMGEASGTYQKMSSAPVMELEKGRTGAPLEKAARMPLVPVASPMSTLPEITACVVSPAPAV